MAREKQVTEVREPKEALVHDLELRGAPVELRPSRHELFGEHPKVEHDRLDLRVIRNVWEFGMKVALRDARDDPHDRADAVLLGVHATYRRSQVSAFSSSLNICFGTYGRLRPLKKLAMTCVGGESASSI